MIKLHPALRRVSDNVIEVQNQHDVPTKIFAKPDVQIEPGAVDELLNFLQVAEDLRGLGSLDEVVVTPDFHKGKGIPIGTVAMISQAVLPQAIGNDIGCGVAAFTTDVPAKDLDKHWQQITSRLRYLFFEGGRDIPMSPTQREAMLLRGPEGLADHYRDNANEGLWKYYEVEQQREDLSNFGGQEEDGADSIFQFSGFVKGSGGQSSRDAQIGSVGGGNHFVEIQEAAEVLDGTTAYNMGVRPGYSVIMVHSGSVSLGHAVGSYFVDRARSLWPTGTAKPKSGFYGLTSTVAEQYIDAMINAVNFAACNRLFLGLMVKRALSEILGRKVTSRLIWDSPHNWIETTRCGFTTHRKGACPAWEDVPVLIPGSMGDSSFILRGLGSQDALFSACHGAGRQMSRGKSMKTSVATEKLRVVTPVDPESVQIKSRKDILKKYEQHLAEESPAAYKPITPIIETIVESKIATPVVRLRPLLTIKG